MSVNTWYRLSGSRAQLTIFPCLFGAAMLAVDVQLHVSRSRGVSGAEQCVWRKATEVQRAMTVGYVARAEGLRPITCDHSRAGESEVPYGVLRPQLRWLRESGAKSRPQIPRSHFPQQSQTSWTSCDQRLRHQRPPGRLISTKMVRKHPPRTPSDATREPHAYGHSAQEMGHTGPGAWKIEI